MDSSSLLGIHGLRPFWARKSAARAGGGPAESPTPEDLRTERLLLAGLRLGLRETLEFLMAGPERSFEEFEAWIVLNNGGGIAPERIERLNGALQGGGGDATFELESILPEPVLSSVDLEFWDQNGYAVVKQAVTREACLAAVDAIFEHAGMSMDRPDSWYTQDLWIPLTHHPALWANRNAPRIHTAFAQIWGRKDLWVNVDVCGVNPPLRPGQTFRGTPLHWDMTLAPPIRFGTQAILYLTDTAANQGAFSCVPGFHRRLKDWLHGVDENPREIATLTLQAIPIAGDAGDLIIWNQALPHSATANMTDSPRVVQYLDLFPSQHEINAEWL